MEKGASSPNAPGSKGSDGRAANSRTGTDDWIFKVRGATSRGAMSIAAWVLCCLCFACGGAEAVSGTQGVFNGAADRVDLTGCILWATAHSGVGAGPRFLSREGVVAPHGDACVRRGFRDSMLQEGHSVSGHWHRGADDAGPVCVSDTSLGIEGADGPISRESEACRWGGFRERAP